MRRLKKSAFHRRSSLHAKLFVFFDKNTGARRFEVNANKKGLMPRDEAASLLAVHCLTSHQMPTDFGVLICADEDLIDALVGGATRLIESGCAAPASTALVQLTRRQNEVLTYVTQNFTNKEIASRLNLSERTVKFHVSTLLEKFHVSRRVELMMQSYKFWNMKVREKETKPESRLEDEGGNAAALLKTGMVATPPISIARVARG
jgi:DNA-binding CsgD family transcriptional regulator